MVIRRETLEQRVIKARDSRELLNSLVKEYRPFIASVAQKRVGRYLEYGVDDELSVGLMAFREAVKSFKKGKAKFLSFARMVISLRLIDHYRKMHNSFEISNDGDAEDVWERQSVELYQLEAEEEDRKVELVSYAALLSKWGIALRDLVRISPKGQELKEQYQEIARMIAGDRELMEGLEKTRRLPIKEIEKKVDLHRKKVERGRIYIIAMVLAIVSGFSYMDIGQGGE